MRTLLLLLAGVYIALAQSTIPELKTTNGKVYQNVRLQMVYSNEVVISYTDINNVRQLENLPLSVLPEAILRACEKGNQISTNQAYDAREVIANITTADGETYTNLVVCTFDETHLVVKRHVPAGVTIVKFDFDTLSAETQKRFGYSHERRQKWEEIRRLFTEQERQLAVAKAEAQYQAWKDGLEERKVRALESAADSAWFEAMQPKPAPVTIHETTINETTINQNQQVTIQQGRINQSIQSVP